MMKNLKDIRPYILYAHIQWLDDSGAVPHIAIKNGEYVRFPSSHSKEPVVFFKIANHSIQKLTIDESGMSFDAMFGGVKFTVYSPLDNLMLLYSQDMSVQIPLSQVPMDTTDNEDSVAENNIEEGDTDHLINNVVEQLAETNSLPVQQKPKLSVVQGGKTDGIPRAKLSLASIVTNSIHKKDE